MKNRFLRMAAVRGSVQYEKDLHVGPFSRIWAPNSLVLGKRVYVGKSVTIETDGVIGDGVLVANNVGIVGRRDHDIRDVGHTVRDAGWVGHDKRLSLQTIVGSDVWIGFGAIILSGSVIGDSSVIGAGQFVSGDIPPNTIVRGVSQSDWGRRFEPEVFHLHWQELLSQGVRRVVER